MHEPVSMHRFFSAYVCCFVLLRFYHTAVWHYGMRLIVLFCIYKVMFAIFGQTRHRGVNQSAAFTREDNNNGVGVKADTLCSNWGKCQSNRIANRNI